jgi:hypothetical protein
MKKRCFAAVLALVMASLGAQEVTDTSALPGFSTGYVLDNFPGTSVDDGRFSGTVRYTRGVSIEERQVFGGLDDNHTVNTATELLAMASVLGIQDVRKEDALKLYTEISMENATNSFLGVTGTTHSQVLERLKNKYNFTQDEITGAIRATVAQVVDAEFGKVSFLLENSHTYSSARSHSAVLTHNSQNGEYILRYEGTYTNGETRTIKADSLVALSSEMRDGRYKADFDQTGRDQVQSRAALIPATIFDGWKRTTPNMVDPYGLLTRALTNFYITPNNENYRIVRGILARGRLAEIVEININRNEDAFIKNSITAISRVLETMSPELYVKISQELRDYKVLVAASEIPNDQRYGIFTLTKAAGDAIFVSKRQPAAGLLVSY